MTPLIRVSLHKGITIFKVVAIKRFENCSKMSKQKLKTALKLYGVALRFVFNGLEDLAKPINYKDIIGKVSS